MMDIDEVEKKTSLERGKRDELFRDRTWRIGYSEVQNRIPFSLRDGLYL